MPCSSVIIGSLFGSVAILTSLNLARRDIDKTKWWYVIAAGLLVLIIVYIAKYTNPDGTCVVNNEKMALLKPGTQKTLIPEFKKIGKPFDILPDALAPWAIEVNLRYPGTKFGP